MAKRIYSNSKETILDAATRILSKGGIKGFTTDAVIRESGLSKAGFFYNFKTKNDLLLALGKRLMTEWQTLVAKYESADKNPVGRSLRALVKATAEHLFTNEPGRSILYQALSELAFSDPKFVEHCYSDLTHSSLIKKNEGISPEQGMLIYVTLEGLCYQRILPTLQMTNAHLKKTIDLLLKMTEGPVDIQKIEHIRGKK